MKTHYSPKTKKIERCSGKCAYGEDTPHFQTKAAGEAWLRDTAAVENETIPDPLGKSKGRSAPRASVNPSAGRTEQGRGSSTIIPRERLRRPESGFAAVVTEDQFRLVGQRYDEKLDVTINEHAGEFVDAGVFSSSSYAGKPRWENLDDESYRTFGFDSYSADEIYHETTGIIPGKYIKETAANLESKLSTKSYSGISYIWEWASDFWCREYQKRALGLTSASEKLDNVLRKFDTELDACSPGEHRVLYRGTDVEGLGVPLEDVKIGAELRFDGYQSTSVSPYVAKNFAGCRSDSPVMLEILSPAGTNVTNKSSLRAEVEVVLPRGSRYVVVGRHEAKISHRSTPVIQMVAVNSKGELLDGTNHDDPPPLK